MKMAFVEYIKDVLGAKDTNPLDTVMDPGLATYVNEFHPRFYHLV